MNLSNLFAKQAELDAYIIKTKGLEGVYLLPNTILALQVELGECANEWRGFKHWSEDKQPRTEKLLVEYVDCLHFILSIGLKIHANEWDLEAGGFTAFIPYDDVTEHFTDMFGYIYGLRNIRNSEYEYENYKSTLELFIGLGEMLGFTWEQIEAAYNAKWEINKQRQENGY